MPVYFVLINLDRLRRNLSAARSSNVSESDVRGLLRRHGYEPAGSGWLIESTGLPLLDRSEVVGAWLLVGERSGACSYAPGR